MTFSEIEQFFKDRKLPPGPIVVDKRMKIEDPEEYVKNCIDNFHIIPSLKYTEGIKKDLTRLMKWLKQRPVD
jgi:hypothetical protein